MQPCIKINSKWGKETLMDSDYLAPVGNAALSCKGKITEVLNTNARWSYRALRATASREAVVKAAL